MIRIAKQYQGGHELGGLTFVTGQVFNTLKITRLSPHFTARPVSLFVPQQNAPFGKRNSPETASSRRRGRVTGDVYVTVFNRTPEHAIVCDA
jgi:hypothetical protein